MSAPTRTRTSIATRERREAKTAELRRVSVRVPRHIYKRWRQAAIERGVSTTDIILPGLMAEIGGSYWVDNRPSPGEARTAHPAAMQPPPTEPSVPGTSLSLVNGDSA